MEEDNKETAMDQSGEEEAFVIPADANETIYIKNLNENVKLDGKYSISVMRRIRANLLFFALATQF